MDLTLSIISQVATISGVVLASGVLTSILTELMKLPFVLVPASKYPKTVAAVIAVLVSGGALLLLDQIILLSWVDWVIFALVTLYVAVKSYDWVLKAVYEKVKKSN